MFRMATFLEQQFAVDIPTSGGPFSLACLEVRASTHEAVDTAVVLHGGPGASMDYLRPQMDRLASERRRLVYYDQRGGGRSTTPVSWPAAGIDDHLADLRALIGALGGRPALIGYSWGGLLALSFALAEPSAITRLLLVAPAPPHAALRDEMKQRLREAGERPDVRAFVATLDRTDKRQRFASAVAGYFHDPHRALELTPFMVRDRAERGVWDSLAGYDLRPRLPSLAVPTHVLHGVDDPVPIEGSRELARLSRATLTELPRCGHAPYIEGGEAFFTAASEFLDGA
jgi:proline iminopeptidase